MKGLILSRKCALLTKTFLAFGAAGSVAYSNQAHALYQSCDGIVPSKLCLAREAALASA